MMDVLHLLLASPPDPKEHDWKPVFPYPHTPSETGFRSRVWRGMSVVSVQSVTAGILALLHNGKGTSLGVS